jgi:acyl-coenzyme A thioesterase PaaI-like protein
MRRDSELSAADAKFEVRVRERFARQGLMKHLGAELFEWTAGYVAIRAPFRTELTQQHNYFHAGVSGAIAGSACEY